MNVGEQPEWFLRGADAGATRGVARGNGKIADGPVGQHQDEILTLDTLRRRVLLGVSLLNRSRKGV